MFANQSDANSTVELIGQHIGPYRLVRLLGEGGMGMVFEGVHDNIGGRAAVKILRPEVAGRPEVTVRFFNEARAANSIQHPGIVRIFDCGYTRNRICYLAMEFLVGESLRARIERVQRFAGSEVLQFGRQIASALHAAHRQRVIHRDLKPDNLMIVPDSELPTGERVKVLDFGIAKVAEELSAQSVRTHTNMLMGTPLYMAPEQCRGARYVTDRSDVYALGVILFQMLSGRPPFIGEGIGELAAMHLIDPPPSLLHLLPHLDAEIAALVHSMLEKQAARRPAMGEVLVSLQRLIQNIPVIARPHDPDLTLVAVARTGNEELTKPVTPTGERAGPSRFRTVGEAASEVQPAPTSQSRRWLCVAGGLLAGALCVGAGLYSQERSRKLESWRTAVQPPIAQAAKTQHEPTIPEPESRVEVASSPSIGISKDAPQLPEESASPTENPNPSAAPTRKSESDRSLSKAQSALQAGRYAEAMYWGSRTLRANRANGAAIIGVAGCKDKATPDSPPQVEQINNALGILAAEKREDWIEGIHTICGERGLHKDERGRYAKPSTH